MSNKITETAQKVLEKRYFIDGETEWEHLAERVARHFGKTQVESSEFFETLCAMDFLPNSPALMNAGTEIHAYSACYVLPVEDSVKSIFKYYSDAGQISKSGGGVGASFTKLRSSGSLVQSTDGVASGPISFMHGQDSLTDIIKQGGRRRGANMGILMCDHEDIWQFVSAKDTPGSLENFNLSVGITDEFMGSMGSFGDQADSNRKLWNELIQRAHSSAEPGVLFMDTIERGNTVPHLGKLEATNPCGEQPLLPYESCTLGSINLSNMIEATADTWGDPKPLQKLMVDYAKLRTTVHTGVLFLNRILDASKMPIPECQEAMELTRKIGLGIMGLHDMLIQLGLPYDSEEGRAIAGEVMAFVAKEADEASRLLGHTEGCYTGWDAKSLPYWRRNANLTTIAPTGTLSMIADCSSGCEPYYAPVTYKSVLDTTFAMPNKWLRKEIEAIIDQPQFDGFTTDVVAETPALWPQRLRDLFKGAEDIHWSDHIKMQAVLQEHVDSSISKTINMPNDATVADVKEAYELAYKLGCKGVTIYRDGSRDSQVLSTKSGKSDGSSEVSQEASKSISERGKATLPDTLGAKRYRVRVGEEKVYILICEDEEGQPMEVFTKFPYASADESWNTVCRQLSLSMRYGIPLEDIIKQLDKSIVVLNDMPSHLSRILKMYMSGKGELSLLCKKCGGQVIYTEGCELCVGCGESKCG